MKLTKETQQSEEYRKTYKLMLPPLKPYESPEFDEMDFNANIDGWFDGMLVGADYTPENQWVSFWQRIEWRFRHYPSTALTFENADLLGCDFCGESVKIDKGDEMYDEHGDGLHKLDGPYGVRDRWFLHKYNVRQTCDGECNPSAVILCDLCYKTIKQKLKTYKEETKHRSLQILRRKTEIRYDMTFHFTITSKRKLDEITN